MTPVEKALQESLETNEKLQALLGERDRVISEREQFIADLEEKIRRLEHNVEVFRKLATGPKTEKRPPVEDASTQLFLLEEEFRRAAEELAQKTGQQAQTRTTSKGKPKRKGRRTKFPKHLPVIRTTWDLPDEEKVCCGLPMEEMGEVVTSKLERVEVTVVHEHARKKYCCRCCQQVVKTATGPDQVIDKGILGTSFLAHLLVERFAFHMPYYRMEQKYASEGLDLSRVVLCQSAQRCADLLQPIHDQIGREVRESPVIHSDDTPIRKLQPRDGPAKSGRMWIYADHEGREYFDFTESRRRDGPLSFLGDFTGYLQADAYSGYDCLYAPEGAIEVACWAHARRKFVEAESSSKEIATEAVDLIRELYAVERQCRENKLSPEHTLAMRQLHSAPLVAAFESWLDRRILEVAPKSPIAKAIRYCKNQWEALCRFLEDGRLEIDNNRAERALRGVAVGRKNWLFVVNESGGKTAAILLTLIQTCRRIGLDPATYIRDVLERISSCPISEIASLTPHGWKQRWAEEIKAEADRLAHLLVAQKR